MLSAITLIDRSYYNPKAPSDFDGCIRGVNFRREESGRFYTISHFSSYRFRICEVCGRVDKNGQCCPGWRLRKVAKKQMLQQILARVQGAPEAKYIGGKGWRIMLPNPSNYGPEDQEVLVKHVNYALLCLHRQAGLEIPCMFKNITNASVISVNGATNKTAIVF